MCEGMGRRSGVPCLLLLLLRLVFVVVVVVVVVEQVVFVVVVVVVVHRVERVGAAVVDKCRHCRPCGG